MSWVKALRKKTKHLYRPLIGAGAWAAYYLCRMIPLAVGAPLARLMGRLCFYLMPQQRALALAHLAVAFKEEKSAHERRAIALASFQHLALNFVECTHLAGLPAEREGRWVRLSGGEYLERALRSGGVVVLSPHMGNWELLAAVIRRRFRVLTVVARHSRYPAVDALTERVRMSNGVGTIYRRQGVRPILRHLLARGTVGTLIDQDIDKVEGAFAPFFGKPAFTPTAILAVARLASAAVLPVSIAREGKRHHVRIEPPLLLSIVPDPERDAALVNEVTERQIRAHPEQWVWFHERWKRQPGSHTPAERV